MKLKPRETDRFLDNPGGAVAVLFYGPDEGLMRERAARLARTILGDGDDPFAKTELTAGDLGEAPSRLADEMMSPTLMGGRRLIQVTGAADSAAKIVETALEAEPPPGFLIVIAGELRPQSRLRRLFEDADNAAAIPCYPDNARDLESLVRNTLAERGHEATEDAVGFLVAHLGADRLVSRGELDKLMLYKGTDPSPISVDDAQAAVGDSAALAIDQVVDAATAGDLAALDRALMRLEAAGESPIGVLRLLSRRLQRLHLMKAAEEGGKSTDQALNTLRPKPFWMEAAAMKKAAPRWTAERLATAMAIVVEAEEQSKTTGFPQAAVCAQACFRIAGAARQSRRGR